MTSSPSTQEELAVFGAEPLFAHVRTTGQLANRDPARFFELAAGAFERRWLTNQGPLVGELEDRLCEFHGTAHCVAFANACFALILSLFSLARPGARKVLLPSLTFRGIPHLIRWAGLEPRYCDVDRTTHTLDPRSLERQISSDTAAVLAVDNASALCNIDALERITQAAGVPLIVDSVYGIGGTYGSSPVGSRGNASVFSLHATKLINGFEGGYLTTNDGELAARLRSQRSFGFSNEGVPNQLGMNAKLNEIHASLALSNLAHIDAIISDNKDRFAAYQKSFGEIPWVSFADYRHSPGTYSMVLLKREPSSPYSREELIAILRAENALVRPYYSPPLHQTDTAAGQVSDPALAASAGISREFIQMPVGDGVSIEDIEALGRLFYLPASPLGVRPGSLAERLQVSDAPDGFRSPLHVGQLNLPSFEDFREAFEGIFERRFFANHGPLEHQLDAALASFFGVRHAVSVANGTAALMLALRGLGVQGEVITTSFTFPATVQALIWAGLKPVFCDVDPQSHMLTPALVEAKIGPATVAILALHAWGSACAPLELAALARRHDLKLVFDAAHAMACTFQGRRIGGFGDAEIFSFHATKILNGMEAGCITTNDDALAARLRAMRSFHDSGDEAGGLLRMNAKISEAQAAMALLGLGKVEQLIEGNRRRFECYRRELRGIPGVEFLDHASGEQSNYQFVIASVHAAEFGMTRNELLGVLRARQVLARDYFHPGVHRTPPFSDERVSLPVTEQLCEILIHLPNGQAITESDVLRICAIIRAAGLTRCGK